VSLIIGDFKISLGRENAARAVTSTPLFVTGRPHVHLRALSTSWGARGGSPRVMCERGSCKQRWSALTDFVSQWGHRKRPAAQSGWNGTSLQLPFNWTLKLDRKLGSAPVQPRWA